MAIDKSFKSSWYAAFVQAMLFSGVVCNNGISLPKHAEKQVNRDSISFHEAFVRLCRIQ